MVQMSGLHKKGFSKLLQAAVAMYNIWNTRISTGLNRWLEHARAHPPLSNGRRLRISMTQIKTRPPTFALFVSRQRFAELLRYLTAGLRLTLGLMVCQSGW